jgi:two-component system LytT family sensor kinase
VALMVTAVALILYRVAPGPRDREKGPKPRWFVSGVLLLAIVQIVATSLSLQGSWLPAGANSAMSLISEHWVIPWSILIAVSLAQIHSADLVLKRSLWLLASVTIAILASRFVFRVPTGLPMVVSTLACAMLILGAPWLTRALTWLIDRVMLKRADHADAARQLDESIRSIHHPPQLFEAASGAVRAAMHVDARFVPADDSPAPAPPLLASIPIETTGSPRYRLEVSASHHARTLMSQEFEFLQTISIHVSRRLDFLHFEAEQRALHLREEKLRRLLTEAELKALRTQVDPHFLFNTLNTIADLIGSDPDKAEKMTVRLAECFRYALSRHARDLSTLDDELEFARHYLEIEQVRFGDRLRVHLSRGDASGSELVPSLLLQPLLENAIRHGLAPVREGGSITVTARRAGENLELQVDDDGVGLRPDFAGKPGIGLQNVKERLNVLYSRAASLAIHRRAGRGTTVSIRVPARGD